MIMRASKAALLLFVLTALVGPAYAQVYTDDMGDQRPEQEKMAEEMKKYRFEKVTTKEGLSFSIPSDMPIERKDGLVTPIPFEEYLYIKFKMIEERMGNLEKQIDDNQKTILSKLNELKAQQDDLASKRTPITPETQRTS